jgi:hypothetical protein
MVFADRDGVVVEHATQAAIAHKQVVPVQISVQDNLLASRAGLDTISPAAPPAH